ncbi:transglutaminase-like domain-containing protein [Actinopolymorpha sp. NPDC004070]|uniref:transglutaminase-like domain-containing protein n=1 Tax=Actinopolymorpha sp. NPDC004070 TaxID=3154548 RepID=UPI0033A5D7A2
MLTTDPTLDFYLEPGRMTSPGRYREVFDGLPRDLGALARVGHGLLVHEHIAPAYGLTLTDEQRGPVHIRPVEQLLERLLADDDSPLTAPRPPERRLAGNCRHFTVLMVAMLRHQGVPARARCGFGGYFPTEAYEDHWVCEYWHARGGRWALLDAQIDDVQRGIFPIDFDVTDVPRERFLVAGDAWARCRAGDADPAKFGLTGLDEFGAWWIAGNLVRDVAALNNLEMLPWDDWGAMPGPDEEIPGEWIALYDRLATLTASPDAGFEELRAAFRSDDRVRVPQTVRNAVLNRSESL